jgi:hypothetical protein
LENDKLYLLAVKAPSQWYRNVLKVPKIRIDGRGAEGKFRAIPFAEDKTVKAFIQMFLEKYGAKDVKKYYSEFDVAVVVEIG